MIISALKQKGNNVIIYFDDGESIVLDYRIVLDYGLRKNDLIDTTAKDKLISESNFVKTKDSAFRFLGRRQHSVYELKTKLSRKKIDKDTVDRVISNFISNGSLDDEKFALAYIEERSSKNIGINKLRVELFKKGISREIVNAALANIDKNLSYDHAIELVKRKLNSFRSRELDKRKIKSKIYSFLNSRGFETEIIMKALNDLLSDEEPADNYD